MAKHDDGFLCLIVLIGILDGQYAQFVTARISSTILNKKSMVADRDHHHVGPLQLADQFKRNEMT